MRDFKMLAFDTETRGGLGGVANYVSWCSDIQIKGCGRMLPRPVSLTDWLLNTVLVQQYDNYFIVAHNGLKFDFSRIDWKKILRRGFVGRVFTAKNINNVRGFDLKLGKCTWKFRDSLTFFPGSLADFTKQFAPKYKKKSSVDFEKESFNPRNKRHVAYAIRDSVGLYHACKNYDGFLREHFNVTMMDCVSLSGVAMKSIKQEAKANGYEQMPALPTYYENLVRSSYHGGFTCAFQIGKFKNLDYYDINSAYAAVMKTYPMPGGSPCMVTVSNRESEKNATGFKNHISLCLATVNFRNSFPYLVSKPGKTTGRFAGVVTGWYWDFELALQQSMGASYKVHKKLIWTESDFRLKHFVAKCERVRHLDYNGPIGTLAKLNQNSGYGKLGSEKHTEDVMLSLEQPTPDAFPLNDHKGRLLEGLWVAEANAQRMKLTMVHWASYITARTRWLLMKYILIVGLENMVACDTDGIFAPRQFCKGLKKFVGKEYGQIKLERHYPYVFEMIAPKVHAGKDDSGRQHIKMKGIPKKKRAYALVRGKAEFEFTRSFMYVVKAKATGRFKKGKLYADTMTRKVSNALNVTCGKFINNRWMPDIITDQDINLIPGLTESDKASIRNHNAKEALSNVA